LFGRGFSARAFLDLNQGPADYESIYTLVYTISAWSRINLFGNPAVQFLIQPSLYADMEKIAHVKEINVNEAVYAAVREYRDRE
jgi:hypothetical protein